jgi:hypothetical protein
VSSQRVELSGAVGVPMHLNPGCLSFGARCCTDGQHPCATPRRQAKVATHALPRAVKGRIGTVGTSSQEAAPLAETVGLRRCVQTRLSVLSLGDRVHPPNRVPRMGGVPEPVLCGSGNYGRRAGPGTDSLSEQHPGRGRATSIDQPQQRPSRAGTAWFAEVAHAMTALAFNRSKVHYIHSVRC